MSVDQHPKPTRNPIRTENFVHVWAWLLVCATFPLIWVGGLVTTTDSGMAFRDWITSDGTFFLFYDWLSSAGDKFIEHGHRLLGAAAGVLAIGLVAIVTWERVASMGKRAKRCDTCSGHPTRFVGRCPGRF